MKLKDVLEMHGFEVKHFPKEKIWIVHQYTPAGEDWSMTFYPLSDFKIYAENYDPREDFKELFEAGQRGFRGVPDIPELWQDQLWKQEVLNMVLEDLG